MRFPFAPHRGSIRGAPQRWRFSGDLLMLKGPKNEPPEPAPRMTFLLSRGGASPKGKFYPRHFRMLAEAFAPESAWTSDAGGQKPGEWVLVIRAPSSYALVPTADNPGGVLSVFDQIAEEEYALLRGKGGMLLLDLGWEALFPRAVVVSGLINSLAARDLDPGRVAILHSNEGAGAAFAAEWQAHTTLPQPRNLAFPAGFAMGLVHQHRTTSEEWRAMRLEAACASLFSAAKPRRYNLFNGNARLHRLYLTAFLLSRGFLEIGHVSMLGYDKKKKDASLARSMLDRNLKSLPFHDSVSPFFGQLIQALPMALDLESEKFMESGQNLEKIAFASQASVYYDETYVSLVTDTLYFDQNTRFMTEKPMKPLMNAAPQLYFGNAGALRRMRCLGFEPSGMMFDEAYDDELDDMRRLEMLLDHVSALNTMPLTELRERAIASWPACRHNFEHFYGDAFGVFAAEFRTRVLAELSQDPVVNSV